MNWGHKIFLSFVFFGIFIITLVVVCVRQDFHLVSEDYYQQELDYEQQLTKERNVLELEKAPSMVYAAGEQAFTVTFPPALVDQVIDGEVFFFRPSDADMDFRHNLKLNESGMHRVDLSGQEKGIWKVQVNWKDGQREYSMDKRIYL